MFRVEKADLMSALATIKEENKSEEEKYTQKLKNIMKECDDLKAKLNLSENILNMKILIIFLLTVVEWNQNIRI